MEELSTFFNTFLHIAEFIAAVVGGFYFFKLKHSYWKWFSVYLVFIFMQEMLWVDRRIFLGISLEQYYCFVGIPIQFAFFYWLYAFKSLNKPLLFIACILAYMLPLIFKIIGIDPYNKAEIYSVFSFSLNLGTVILTVLIILEFIKQIKNDNILKFKENKMFYINTGMFLFYLGNYPFHTFNEVLYKDYNNIYYGYYLYFLITNCLMYLLFAASFIWGKKS